MKNISDNELVGELVRRLSDYSGALSDLKSLTRKLETVNRKLQESEATKSNFLSNIRNEINNPLTSIMGLSKYLATGDTECDETVKLSENIYHEAFELDFQLNNIFISAEIEAGESPLSVANINIVRFLKHFNACFAHKIKEKSLTLEVVSPDGEDANFKTDPMKLYTIMINLMSNAIEFSLEGKKITLYVSIEDDILKITITDEGIGIANEEKELIFDRFRQLETGTRKQHKGHGLGLSVVKALLNQLDGNIGFSGIAGDGCTFTVSIPGFVGDADVDVFAEDGNEFIFDKEEEF